MKAITIGLVAKRSDDSIGATRSVQAVVRPRSVWPIRCKSGRPSAAAKRWRFPAHVGWTNGPRHMEIVPWRTQAGDVDILLGIPNTSRFELARYEHLIVDATIVEVDGRHWPSRRWPTSSAPERSRTARRLAMRCSNSARSRASTSITKRTPSRRTSATTSSPAIATGVATSHHAANAACCLSRRVRFVAFGIAGSRRVETIALPECDRPECGMVRRRRTAGFGRKAVAPRSVRRCVLQWQSDDWSLGRPWPPVPARLIRLSAAVRSWRVYLELNPVDAVHSRIQRGPIAVP